MNHQPKPDRSFLHFMLRAQQLARRDARSDQGYAMMMTSLIAIALFSLLAAYFTLTNLSKSSTNAYIDGTSTFYAAESGLNKRAEQLRQKFVNYANPTGSITNTASNLLSTCASVTVNAPISNTDDFECRNYSFTYNNNIAQATAATSNTVVLSEQDGGQNTINYTAYTFVKPERDYTTTPPAVNPIPAGQAYAGLNALEYRYTVYSTAAKLDPNNPSNPAQQSSGQTVLQMDFRSRIVPLFQFAAFYQEDLEMNSTSTMTLSGRVHTNANMYLQPTPQLRPAAAAPAGITSYFFSPITAGGDIYNRVNASTNTRYSAPRILQSGNPFTNVPPPVFYPDSNFRLNTTLTTPLSAPEIATFGGQVRDGAAGATVLNTPDAGFLRKRNYFNNKIGEYYSKADLRLEMVPDRDVTSRSTTAIWGRNSAIIPFNFTSIQTGGTGACTTALPAAGSDPAANYIDSDRNSSSSLRCNVFTKGQLQSLRQPVMVLTNLNQSAALRDTALPTTAAPSPTRGTESTILDRPATFSALPTGLTTAVTGNVATQNRILRALQVALVSTPSPVSIDQLNLAFSNSSYNTNTNANTGITFNGSLLTFRQTFGALLNNIGIATGSTDYNALLAASPNSIAALRGAWFLPAPVQRIENRNTTVQIAANPRNSGFYDGREQRWITMLQTNIASLSVWNRDGLYVEASDTVLTTPYQTNTGLQNAAFNGGTGANFTSGFAFVRSAATGTVGLPFIGLGSSDGTEGGLVFHATVNDDLDGNGGALVAANDITSDSATPIYKKNPNGTDFLDSSGNMVVLDYARKYLDTAPPAPPLNGNTSPFGFAFNGGDYLPGSMTLVTDQAIYVQGNFNNNAAIQPAAAVNTPSPDRRPAAIMGDTITILSNQCLSGVAALNDLVTPSGQINCGIPSTNTGSTVGFGRNFYTVTGPTAVNAAFLSSTRRSCNNLGANRACVAPVTAAYSGGLNNYMRMLEDWQQAQYFNYSGSFVSLGTPLEYSGEYNGGGGTNSYYNIPVRNFNFEQNFNSFSLLPPLSPSAIYLQQEVFKRAYN